MAEEGNLEDIEKIYEQMFAYRYTEDDPDYKKTISKPIPPCPCVTGYFTRSKRNFDNRDNRRGGRGNWGNRGRWQGHGNYDRGQGHYRQGQGYYDRDDRDRGNYRQNNWDRQGNRHSEGRHYEGQRHYDSQRYNPYGRP